MLANFLQLLIYAPICKSNRQELNSVGIHQVLSEGHDFMSSSVCLLIMESASRIWCKLVLPHCARLDSEDVSYIST